LIESKIQFIRESPACFHAFEMRKQAFRQRVMQPEPSFWDVYLEFVERVKSSVIGLSKDGILSYWTVEVLSIEIKSDPNKKR
jgi:hypothetical protein